MTVVGHLTQQKFLNQLIERDRVPSALLFSGVRSIGKRSIAEAFARKILCDQRGRSDLPILDGCGNCGSCRTARHGNNPDLIAIDCEQKESGQADAVRSVLAALGLKAFGSRARVVIIDNADELSVQLGNMLLKNLEEPRPDTYFVLVTANRSKILPTILSRTQTLFFESLAPDELAKIIETLKQQGSCKPIEGDLQRLAGLADGSVAGLLELSEHHALFDELSGDLRAIARGAADAVPRLLQHFTRDKDRALPLLRFLSLIALREMREESDPVCKNAWAVALTNLMSAERVSADRNLSLNYLMPAVLRRLLPGAGDRDAAQAQLDETSLISELYSFR